MCLRKMRVVALPADVLFFVCFHVDSRYDGLGRRVLGVTTAAELASRRLARTMLAWSDLMLFGRVVAICALDINVVRYGFGSRYCSVACFAFPRRFRRHGIVRIVTGDARLQGVVRGRDNLWEPRRSRSEILMTQRAVAPLSRRLRHESLRVVGVCGGGPVADLTRDGVVVPAGLRIDDIIMAIVADLMAGVPDFDCCSFFEGRGSVVTVLSKIPRDEETPDRYEHSDNDREQYDQALDLFRNP